MRQGALTRAVRDSSQPVRESQANGNRRPNAAQTMPEHEPAGTSTLEIANAIVRSYKEILGRGLTKTRVLFAGADTLVVVLEDTMTVQDRNVAALGEHERLREQRLFLTTAAEDQFRSIVEGALGRRTLAWVSGFDIHHDIAIQIFTLRTRAHRRTRRADIRLTASGIG
jgi:uncharacterized protein YbcI